MPFRHRRRHLRFGLPEALLVVLAGLFIVPAAGWLATFQGADWHRTVATIAGAEYVAGSSPERDGDLIVHYAYTVMDREYSGRMPLGPVGRQVMLSLAPELRRALEERGIKGFEDMPEDIRAVLASREVTGFDAIPKPLAEDLHARGYRNTDDLPKDMRDALQRGDHATVARRLDELLPRTSDGAGASPSVRAVGTRRITLQGRRAERRGAVPTIYVFYNPAQPGEHVVSLFKWRMGNLLLLVAGLGMLLTLGYGMWIYPRLLAYRRR